MADSGCAYGVRAARGVCHTGTAKLVLSAGPLGPGTGQPRGGLGGPLGILQVCGDCGAYEAAEGAEAEV